MNDVHYLKILIYKLLLHSKYRIFNRLSNLLILLSGTISCMVILQGEIYSQSVTVILEYVDLFFRLIGSKVLAAIMPFLLLRFIVTSIVFNTMELQC